MAIKNVDEKTLNLLSVFAVQMWCLDIARLNSNMYRINI